MNAANEYARKPELLNPNHWEDVMCIYSRLLSSFLSYNKFVNQRTSSYFLSYRIGYHKKKTSPTTYLLHLFIKIVTRKEQNLSQ